MSFLADHAENVIAVHCKAGKGRSGTLICALLMHIYPLRASAAIEKYNTARMVQGPVGASLSLPWHSRTTQAITVPSQLRYIAFYGEALRMGLVTPIGLNVPAPVLFLSKILFKTTPRVGPNGSFSESREVGVADSWPAPVIAVESASGKWTNAERGPLSTVTAQPVVEVALGTEVSGDCIVRVLQSSPGSRVTLRWVWSC